MQERLASAVEGKTQAEEAVAELKCELERFAREVDGKRALMAEREKQAHEMHATGQGHFDKAQEIILDSKVCVCPTG